MRRIFGGTFQALNLAVAIHAYIQAWHRRMAAFFRLRVTVLAIQSHVAGVKLVAKGNGLLGRVACTRRVALAAKIEHLTQDQKQGNSQQGTNHRTTPFVSACTIKVQGVLG